MNYQIDFESYPNVRAPTSTLSEDGYVRLTLEALLAIPLVHLLSGLDDDSPILPQEGASFASISGYTEWLSTTAPIITVGWDWRLDVSQGLPIYVRLVASRSNVMLVDVLQQDLGFAKTSYLLGTAIDALAWQEKVCIYITSRYA
jgi:hypothetical protein